MAKVGKFAIIILGALGLYGLLAAFGVLQGISLTIPHTTYGISWAAMACGLFSLVAALKVKV